MEFHYVIRVSLEGRQFNYGSCCNLFSCFLLVTISLTKHLFLCGFDILKHLLFVVKPALQNVYTFIAHGIDEPVFVGYSPTPKTRVFALERLRLTDTTKRASKAVLYQVVYTH